MMPTVQSLKSVAVIGNYLPRRCGIATFTRDLCEALAREQTNGQKVIAVAMDDVESGYKYPERVKFEIRDNTPADYLRAAEFLNINKVDVAILQHEFGIFGGQSGSHILYLLQNLRMPLLTTLHTVLPNPSPKQKAIIHEIGQISDSIIVMSQSCTHLLRDMYQVPEEKIVVIPHGIPDVSFMDSCFYKDLLGVEHRKVVLTFGLLGPGKGIEYGIDAMVDVVKHHPDAVYVVLGATHPHVIRSSGEKYRHELIQRVRTLGIEDHVVFFNQFLDLQTLTQFLTAADVYLTPSLTRQQAVSGTLSYALGAGKAVVSTPYPYAEELLADGRGVLVPFASSNAIAEAVTQLLSKDGLRNTMRKQAYQYCRGMVWKEVARSYLQRARASLTRLAEQPRFAILEVHTKDIDALPAARLDHLRVMTDETGILRHAVYSVPDRKGGYCLDDNARALIAATLYYDLRKDVSAIPLIKTYLSFLSDAFDRESHAFKYRMLYDRTWDTQKSSEDAHGRALWALGTAIRLSPDDSLREMMCRLFIEAVDPAKDFKYPRSCAFALLGIHNYMQVYAGDATVRAIRNSIADGLHSRFQAVATADWPWCDDELSYANARLPHALIVSGADTGNEEMRDCGISALKWLLGVERNGYGHISLIGSEGGMKRGGVRSHFSQKPLEAMALLQASADAFRVTGDNVWMTHARECLDWFMGRNDLGVPVYDFVTCGCYDGIDPQGINENMGAEATVSWLISLLTMYAMMGEEMLVREKMTEEQEEYAATACQEA